MKKGSWLLTGSAVVSVAAVVYAYKRKKQAEQAIEAADEAVATAQQAVDQLVLKLSQGTGQSSETVKKLAGPLEVSLEVRASGIEKLFAGDISGDVRKTAIKIAQQLASSCSRAPKLAQANPTVLEIKDSDRGFRVRLQWPAVWGSETTGPVRPEVRDCIEALIKKNDAKLGERLLSLTASRAYATP